MDPCPEKVPSVPHREESLDVAAEAQHFDGKRWARTFVLIAAIAALIYSLFRKTAGSVMLDLEVYRMGSASLVNGNDNLYSLVHYWKDLTLLYTYPPFSTVVFAPISFGSATLATQMMGAIIICALARASWLLGSHMAAASRGSALTLSLAIFTLGLAGEPGRSALGLGQVATILAWLLVEDWLGLGRGRRLGGVLTGIATGIKLVPAIYIAAYAVLGQWRRAGLAGMTFLATAVVGAVLLPVSSRLFWTGVGFDASRVGDVATPGNQSLKALAWRTVPPESRIAWWMFFSLVVGCVWIYLIRGYDRAGDVVAVVLLTGLAGLLVSPVSWSHHWVWLAPTAIWLWLTSGLSARFSLKLSGRVITCGAVGAMVLGPALPEQSLQELGWAPLQWLIGDSYVLIGVLVLLWAVGNLLDRSTVWTTSEFAAEPAMRSPR